jgi:GT2 family glycosyltransferase
MPFAGDEQGARAAIENLRTLDTRPGDVLILADNSGVAPAAAGVEVVRARAERSPSHARNVGAKLAATEWILFIDADCRVTEDLLDAYFAGSIVSGVGALAGEVVPAPGALTLAARYAGSRNFLRQEAHLAHTYRPRAVAANVMVRRTAFEQVGGFYEGLRAAEDTDFSWRLQAAGWGLELRPAARVEHRYRSTVSELRRQWRGYAAGRAWLARRYDGFEPEPALLRAAGRVVHLRRRGPRESVASAAQGPAVTASPLERARFLALDALLGLDELAGFALSNRPSDDDGEPAQVVLVADRFPVQDDPMVDFARTLAGARVEAAARPQAADPDASRGLRVHYREDDGFATRVLALARLAGRHPGRSVADVLSSHRGDPSLLALAPAAVRLERDEGARVHVLGGQHARAAALRLARLAGRSLGAPGT